MTAKSSRVSGGAKNIMLHINDLTYRIEGRPLFEQATLAIAQGQKVGLVGRNGTGKSTLFRLIKGEIAADDGSITLRASAALIRKCPAGRRR
jgi:ATP-binding cassette subfamily F protein 3